MTLRPFDPENDYPALARIVNANFPAFAETEDEIRYGDNYRDPSHRFARFLAEDAGVVVGSGHYGQSVHHFHPRKFEIEVFVAPERQGEGIGRALYERVVTELAPLEPLGLRTWTMETQARALRFFADRGFAEEMRSAESWLEVAAFDPARFAGADARVAEQGIRIAAVAELDGADPQVRQRLYRLSQAVHQDIPSPDPVTAVPYEVWAKRFDSPNYRPDGQFLALAGDEMVGISALWGRQADDHLQTGVTGVLRTHRRRGIALALKLRAIAYARSVGAPVIRTDNEVGNVGMLSINEALGFVRQPAWIVLGRLQPEGDAGGRSA